MKRTHLFAVGLLTAGLYLVGGCKDETQPATQPARGHTDHHDHDHDAHGADEHEEHDAHAGHDHEEEEQEEHDHGHEYHAHGVEHDAHVDEVTLTPEAIKNAGIRIEPVTRQKLTGTFMAPARVSFNLEGMAHVGTPISGRVVEIKARAGDVVKAGDVLLVIDSPELGEAQSDFLQKRTAVNTARPAVELAKISHERAKNLYDESQGISLTEVQKREAEWRAAQGVLQSAEAAVMAGESRLRLLGMSDDAVNALIKSGEIDPTSTVHAPIAGEVIEREVTLGELVGPEREALLVLADMSTLWVLADVPEARFRHVTKGAKVRVISVHADGIIEGTVAYLDPRINPATHSGSVRIEVKGSALRPGMFVQAEIHIASDGKDAAALAVPTEAIQTLEGKSTVFVAVDDEPNTFAPRAVKVGEAFGGMVPVLDGLSEGERIVAKNSFILKAELGKAGAAHEH